MRAWIANNRQVLLRSFGTILALVLIIILIEEEGWGEIVTAFRSLSLVNILIGLIFILISRLLVATRWFVLLHTARVPISFWRAIGLSFTGLFASNFLPTTVGGDVVRLAGAMQMGYDRAVCLASIAADRLTNMFGMAMALPMGLPQTLAVISKGVTAASAVPVFWNRIWGFTKRTFQSFSLWLNRPAGLLVALACTIVHLLCNFACLYVLTEGLGTHVDFWLLGGLWSVTYFVTLVPVSINGFGVQELSLTYLLSSVAGVPAGSSLTVAIMIRAFYMIGSLPGAASLPSVLAAMDTRGDSPDK